MPFLPWTSQPQSPRLRCTAMRLALLCSSVIAAAELAVREGLSALSQPLTEGLKACDGCARALLIVAHPDDETLFSGELLLGRAAALPGGCRRACWHVICATNGDVLDRRADFRRAVLLARSHGMAADISMEIWNYEDCNMPHCEHFGGDIPIVDRIEEVLSGATTGGKPWDYVITHNQHGEYHHMQHYGLHKVVKALLRQGGSRGKVPGNPRFFVFNPLPELNVSMSVGKKRMADCYLAGAFDKPYRILLFQSLTKYSENVVQVEDFPRHQLLGLGYFQGALHQDSLHFSYAWALAKNKDWGELGDFTGRSSLQFVNEMLHVAANAAGCHGDSAHLMQYPTICAQLQQSVADDGPILSLLNRMEETANYLWSGISTSSQDDKAVAGGPDCGECCEGGAPLIGMDCVSEDTTCREHCRVPTGSAQRCLSLTPIGKFGTVNSWEITGRGSESTWIELIVARPILVGWRNGYKGHTYRILGSSGPQRLNFSASGEPLKVLQTGVPVSVQPHDVLGWGIFGKSTSSAMDSAPAAAEGRVCLAEGGCDESNLCVFKEPSSPEAAFAAQEVVKIEVDLQPRTLVALRSGVGPYKVRESLNISEYLEPTTTYEELLTLRQRLEHPDNEIFEDKIRLRRELLNVIGVAATPSIHLSNTDFNIKTHLSGRRGFVVKPSHMSESQNVFVVRDGINLLQQAWGWPPEAISVTPDQIQASVDAFAKVTALDWECRALVGVRPGVIVEDLVLAQDEETGQYLVDEYKFYVVWGKVVFGEKVPFSSGAALEIARDGTVLMAKAPCPPVCVASCFSEMVREAEHVATSTRTDYLRVDFLIKGRCEGMFVSEVELYPASDFSPDLKRAVAKQWLAGYGL